VTHINSQPADSQVVALIPDDPFLAEGADRIRQIRGCATVEIGRILTECRKRFPKRGGWLAWLKREFAWTDRTALNHMRKYELLQSEKFSDLELPDSSRYLLGAPSCPESARDEVIRRAEAGEKLKHDEVRAIIASHKPPTPAKAPAHKRTKRPPQITKSDERRATGNGGNPAAEEPFKSAVALLAALNRERSFTISRFGDKEYETAPAEILVSAISLADVEDARDFLVSIEEAIQDAERKAKKAKQIAKEAKHPEKARAKAREEAIRAAMEDDIAEAKREAKESGERWADIKDDRIEEWIQDNWGDEQEAEFDKEFCKNWQSDHGAPFGGAAAPKNKPPASTPAAAA
jgi:hypothetical protein